MPNTQDVRPGEPGYALLRQAIIAQRDRDRAAFAAWDARFKEQDAVIARLKESERAFAVEQVRIDVDPAEQTTVAQTIETPPAEVDPAFTVLLSTPINSPEYAAARSALGLGSHDSSF